MSDRSGVLWTNRLQGLLSATLAMSLADSDDREVLAALEATTDAQRRIDLLVGTGTPAATAAVYAELDVALVREAFTDPCAALDEFIERLRTPGSPAPGAAA